MSPKILLVLGDQDKIDVPFTVAEIESFFKTTVTQPITLSRNGLLDIISDQFDIIIILGHNDANDNGIDGRIRISSKDTISIDDFSPQFRRSVANGLKLVILAGCSGIGAARTLGANPINVPNVIAFRAPIHYEILRLFFEKLCKHWIDDSQSLEVAVTKTREDLSTADKKTHPAASILPILYTSAFAIPFQYSTLAEANPEEKTWWQTIEKIKRFARSSIGKILGLIALFALSAFISVQIFVKPDFAIVPDLIKNNTDISLGEKELIKYNDPKLQEGFNHFRDGNYELAMRAFTKNLSNKNNKYRPEIVIARNNAKAAQQARYDKKEPIRIAAAVPLINNISVSREILTGIAMYQEKAIEDGIRLQIAIGQDKNEAKSAKEIAEVFAREKSILGVIGHNASAASIAASEVYNLEKLVMLSPTSFDPELTTNKDNTIKPYIYQMVSRMDYLVQTLKSHIEKFNDINLATCIDPESSDSRAFEEKFNEAAQVRPQKYTKLKKCKNFKNLSNRDIQEIVEESNKSNAILASIHVNSLDKAINLFKAIKQSRGLSDIKFFGSPTFNTHATKESAGIETDGLTIVVPYFADSKNWFAEKYYAQWDRYLDNWRTPMAYVSTELIVNSLKDLNKGDFREALNQRLSNGKIFSEGKDNMIINDFKFNAVHQLEYIDKSSPKAVLIKLKDKRFVKV
jgi:branched-chain amino acid transport system substrate-binding protein